MKEQNNKKMTGEMGHLLKILRKYPGREKAIGLACLFEAFSGETLERNTEGRITENVPTRSRRMRSLISKLRDDHAIPIMSSVSYGYWIVVNEDELKKVCNEFTHRGLTSLRTSARLANISLVEAVQQLNLELQDENSLLHKKATASKIIRNDQDYVLGPESKMAIITKHLQDFIANPEQYAEQLQAIQREFGPRLLPPSVQREIDHQVQKVRMMANQTIAAADKLQGMVK